MKKMFKCFLDYLNPRRCEKDYFYEERFLVSYEALYNIAINKYIPKTVLEYINNCDRVINFSDFNYKFSEEGYRIIPFSLSCKDDLVEFKSDAVETLDVVTTVGEKKVSEYTRIKETTTYDRLNGIYIGKTSNGVEYILQYSSDNIYKTTTYLHKIKNVNKGKPTTDFQDIARYLSDNGLKLAKQK
nr:MAG TPA: hypothetical protein [Caudoviricetes sp.]DAT07188.1 MAG TPA: hypothetical protein [Caudoviricetes sp.]